MYFWHCPSLDDSSAKHNINDGVGCCYLLGDTIWPSLGFTICLKAGLSKLVGRIVLINVYQQHMA